MSSFDVKTGNARRTPVLFTRVTEVIMGRFIYLDNAATTKVYPEVAKAVLPYFTELYGNPSSIYSFAGKAKDAVEEAREAIAGIIGAKPNEIYFTGGGSESDNWAIKSTVEAYGSKGAHVITTKIEHHAVLHTCEWLENNGCEVTYLDVDENGLVNPADVEAAIKDNTVLISVMMANNEIGTIEPIAEIGEIARRHGVLFHTDAVQAYCHVPIDVNKMNIDMLSASGHKVGAPKGVGFLYMKRGIRNKSFLHGGAQERGKRAGTTNVPGIVGLAMASRITSDYMKEHAADMASLRDYLIKRVTEEIPYSICNGDRVKRLPNNANFCFRFIEGESLLLLLDNKGICGSSGSACTSASLDPSHVLLAIGLPHEIAHGSLRLTLSSEITKEDIDYTVDCLKEIVARLRSMSPLYDDFIKNEK